MILCGGVSGTQADSRAIYHIFEGTVSEDIESIASQIEFLEPNVQTGSNELRHRRLFDA